MATGENLAAAGENGVAGGRENGGGMKYSA